MPRRRLVLASLSLLLLPVGLLALPAAGDTRTPAIAQAPLRAAERAACGVADRVETGLQGQVPAADRVSGRSRQGYACNLRLAGQFAGEGASWQMAWHEHCAYYGTARRDDQEHPGTVVVDVSNPRLPRASAYLTAPAMLDPWESLKVNGARELLAAVEKGGDGFAIYDVGDDCSRPTLLSSIRIPGSEGHAGTWAPDGRTYYAGQDDFGSMIAIDTTDPRRPRAFYRFTGLPGGAGLPHDLSLSTDGTRAYIANIANPVQGPGGVGATGRNGLVVLDVSDLQRRRPQPRVREVGSLFWSDGSTAQTTQPVRIGGKPYLVFTDELGARGLGSPASWSSACAEGLPPFGYGRLIDLSDERRPRIVGTLGLEVSEPENCARTVPDLTGTAVFGYDAHYCTVDDPKDTRLVGCSFFQSGVRVFDVRDPRRPVEVAYYNPPAQPGTYEPGSNMLLTGVGATADWTASNVRLRLDRGEVWFTSHQAGFQVLQLTNGLRRPPARR